MGTVSDLNKKISPLLKRPQYWLEHHPYWGAYITGIVYFSLVFSWMVTIRTGEVASGLVAQLVVISTAVVTVSSLSVGFIIFVWFKRRLQLRWTNMRALWLIPALWVISEYVRAIVFSIVSLGPDGRIGPYWTFGHLGYYAVDTPFVYMARLGGLYLLSFMIMAMLVAIYQWWHLNRWQPFAVIMSIALICSGLGWSLYRSTQGRIVSVGAAKYARRETPYQYSSESYAVLNSGPKRSLDVLVLPEYSHYFDASVYQKADQAVLTPLMKRDNGLIIHSSRENTSTKGHNLLTFQTVTGDILNQQQKWFIVPAGEYVPYIYQVALAYAGHGQMLLNFNQQKSVSRGEAPEQPFLFEGVKYGAQACSGVLSPDFYSQLARQGAEIFTNSAALDTLGISPLFHHEVEQMNRLSAVAHAKPFVQSAKGGPAYIMDKDGRQLTAATASEGVVISADVQTNSRRTLYSWLGDWVVYVSAAAVVWLVARLVVKRYYSRY